MTSLLGFMLGIKLEGTSIENSMKRRAKQAGDFFGQPKKYTQQVKLETQLPRGQVSRKISVEHCSYEKDGNSYVTWNKEK